MKYIMDERKMYIYNHTIIDYNTQKEEASNFHISTNGGGGGGDSIEMTTRSVGFNHLRGAPTGLIEPEKKHKTRVVIEVINCGRREIR